MTDLEMTKLCAEAMGLSVFVDAYGALCIEQLDILSADNVAYDPLTNDAQAMALVKRLEIDCLWLPDEKTWVVGQHKQERGYKCRDLNRAIVECVAKMHAANREAKCS